MLVYYATLRQFMRIPMGGSCALLMAALQEQFRAHQRAEWLAENKVSIEAINQWVDENGSFSDFQRSF